MLWSWWIIFGWASPVSGNSGNMDWRQYSLLLVVRNMMIRLTFIITSLLLSLIVGMTSLPIFSLHRAAFILSFVFLLSLVFMLVTSFILLVSVVRGVV